MPEGNGGVNPIQVQKVLKGLDYPVSKDDLLKKARESGTGERVVSTLEKVGRDRFNSPNDVSEALGQNRLTGRPASCCPVTDRVRRHSGWWNRLQRPLRSARRRRAAFSRPSMRVRRRSR